MLRRGGRRARAASAAGSGRSCATCGPPTTGRRPTGRASWPPTSRCCSTAGAPLPRVRRWRDFAPAMGPRAAGRCRRSPSPGELAERLELDAGQLDWLADPRGLERRRARPPAAPLHATSGCRGSGAPPRPIARPKRRLKEIQRWILHAILDRIPAHDAAHGFVARALGPHARRAATPAAPRSLRIDLEDFFASVPGGAGVRHLPHRGLSRGGRARADRAVRHRRPARRVGGGAAPGRPAADRPPPPARAPPGDAAPAAGRADLAGARVARGDGPGPAARRRSRRRSARGYSRYADDLAFSGAADLPVGTLRRGRGRGRARRGLPRRRATRRACAAATSARWSRRRRQRAPQREPARVRPPQGDPPRRGPARSRGRQPRGRARPARAPARAGSPGSASLHPASAAGGCRSASTRSTGERGVIPLRRMAYVTGEARQDLLDTIADAIDEIGAGARRARRRLRAARRAERGPAGGAALPAGPGRLRPRPPDPHGVRRAPRAADAHVRPVRARPSLAGRARASSSAPSTRSRAPTTRSSRCRTRCCPSRSATRSCARGWPRCASSSATSASARASSCAPSGARTSPPRASRTPRARRPRAPRARRRPPPARPAGRAAARGRSRSPPFGSCSRPRAPPSRSSARSSRCTSFCAARRTAPGGAAAFAAAGGRGGRGRAVVGVAQRDVLVDPAGQVAQPPVAEQRVDVVAHALDEVAVVADDDERARPAVEQVLERGERVDVEVVGRLVEQQHVRLVHQQPHELEPAPLAAREVAHERARLVAAEAEAVAEQPGGDLLPAAERGAPAHRLERLEHAQVARDLRRVLGEVGEPDGRAALDDAVGGRELAARAAAPASSCPSR